MFPGCPPVWVLVVLGTSWAGGGSPGADAAQLRQFYVAAQHVSWSYYHPEPANLSLNPFATSFKKIVYREYDAYFKKEKPRSSISGLLGPTLYAEVGDTMKIHFKNKADKPVSIHPQGIKYSKFSEGASYADHTYPVERMDDAIAPGQEYTYEWIISEDSGPTPDDPPCLTHIYYSHENLIQDFNSGLIGPLLICKEGTLSEDGTQKMVDKQHVLLFAVFDESKSWSQSSSLMYTVNGYVNGTMPDIMLCAYDHVSWHLIGMSSGPEMFSIHFNGQVLEQNHHKVSAITLVSATSTTANMTVSTGGRWTVSSLTPKHLQAGMQAYINIENCPKKTRNPKKMTVEQRRHIKRWEYFIAAEEVIWDYAPVIPANMDKKYRSLHLDNFSNQIGKHYKKVVYKQYQDESFTKREENLNIKEDGILGPVIRAQVRDTLKITFKNMASRPYSIYPHGVTFSPYEEVVVNSSSNSGSHTMIRAVQPGETYTYKWNILEFDEPTENDAQCLTRPYYSDVDITRDIASGLIGLLLICKSRSLDKRGIQRTVTISYPSIALCGNIYSYGFLSCLFSSGPSLQKASLQSNNVCGFSLDSRLTPHEIFFSSFQVFLNSVRYHLVKVYSSVSIFVIKNVNTGLLSLSPLKNNSLILIIKANKNTWLEKSDMGIWKILTYQTRKGNRQERHKTFLLPSSVLSFAIIWLIFSPSFMLNDINRFSVAMVKQDFSYEDILVSKFSDLLRIGFHPPCSQTHPRKSATCLIPEYHLAKKKSPSQTVLCELLHCCDARAMSCWPRFSVKIFLFLYRCLLGLLCFSQSANDFNTQFDEFLQCFQHSHDATQKHATIMNATQQDTTTHRQEHSGEILTYQGYETLLSCLFSAANTSACWRVHERGSYDPEDCASLVSENSVLQNAFMKPIYNYSHFLVKGREVEGDRRGGGKFNRGTANGGTTPVEHIVRVQIYQVYNHFPLQRAADMEQQVVFAVFDENKSWYIEDNINKFCENPEEVNRDDPKFYESNIMSNFSLLWLKYDCALEAEMWVRIHSLKSIAYPHFQYRHVVMKFLTSGSAPVAQVAKAPATCTPGLTNNFFRVSLPSNLNQKNGLVIFLNATNRRILGKPHCYFSLKLTFLCNVNPEKSIPSSGALQPSCGDSGEGSNSSLEISPGFFFFFKESKYSPCPGHIFGSLVSSFRPVANRAYTIVGFYNKVYFPHLLPPILSNFSLTKTGKDLELTICSFLKNLAIYTEADGLQPSLDLLNNNDKLHMLCGDTGGNNLLSFMIRESANTELKRRIRGRFLDLLLLGRRLELARADFYNPLFSPILSNMSQPGPFPASLSPGFTAQPHPDHCCPSNSSFTPPSFQLFLPLPSSCSFRKDQSHFPPGNLPYFFQPLLNVLGNCPSRASRLTHTQQHLLSPDVYLDLQVYVSLRLFEQPPHLFHLQISSADHNHFTGSREPRNKHGVVFLEMVVKIKMVCPSYSAIVSKLSSHNHLLWPINADMLGVRFKNLASRPYSLHAHGLSYEKSSEGKTYEDDSPEWFKEDNAVPPNSSYTYVWHATGRSGPESPGSACRAWAYYSSVNPEKDIHSGLIGPLLICRKGTLDKSNMPVDMREFVLLFMVFDEKKSWYYEKEPKRPWRLASSEVKNSHEFHAINGMIYNLPGLRMYEQEWVRFHLLNVGGSQDIHVVHFHGQTLLENGNQQHQLGVWPLLPGAFKTLEMKASKPGWWLLNTEVGENQRAGMQTPFLVIDKDCKMPMGLSTGLISDTQIKASEYLGSHWEPRLARLNNIGSYNAWSVEKHATESDSTPWIQVDMQKEVVITGIQTQGAKHYLKSCYTTQFYVAYSSDRINWQTFKGNSTKNVMYFDGNSDASSIKTNQFDPPIVARFIRISPTRSYNRPTLRLELQGCEVNGCSTPLGMESGKIENKQITASSFKKSWWGDYWEPYRARLNAQGRVNAWQAKANNNKQWLQIDLLKIKKITAITTQGCTSLSSEMYVKSYTIYYSDQGVEWKPYRQRSSMVDKLFEGNVNTKGHMKNIFNPPIISRFIRIIPKTWNQSIALRLELFGCDIY
uniref:Coagulation factor V n=1 Tax=Otolemur garnettii TaxID=30611 RepID=H0X1W2_OTOGA